MEKNNKEDSLPNGSLSFLELLSGYILILCFMIIAYANKDNASITIAALTFSSLIEIFLLVFRKRPISANFKVGLTSGIDLRWVLKRNEKPLKEEI